jgi:hypothetical protein
MIFTFDEEYFAPGFYCPDISDMEQSRRKEAANWVEMNTEPSEIIETYTRQPREPTPQRKSQCA